MFGKHLRAVLYCVAAAVSGMPSVASAQNADAVSGTYCLVGVMEVGSCIRLSAGGGFEYFLAYGAYDEKSEGTWRVENGHVIIDSPAYDKRPAFAFKRMQPGDPGAFGVIVETKSGRSLAGIDVGVTCDGTTKRAGVTQEVDFRIDCKAAPTAMSLGLRMFDVGPQAINVADRAGSGNVYVFEFEPGDLGRKPFVAHRLRPDGDGALSMIYDRSPIRELEGRTFRYVRSR